MKAMLPNACTALNLFFGMLSILSTYDGDYYCASIFIFFALIADGRKNSTCIKRYFVVIQFLY